MCIKRESGVTLVLKGNPYQKMTVLQDVITNGFVLFEDVLSYRKEFS